MSNDKVHPKLAASPWDNLLLSCARPEGPSRSTGAASRKAKKEVEGEGTHLTISQVVNYASVKKALAGAQERGASFVLVRGNLQGRKEKMDLAKIWRVEAFPETIEDMKRAPLSRAINHLKIMAGRGFYTAPMAFVRVPLSTTRLMTDINYASGNKVFSEKNIREKNTVLLSNLPVVGIMTSMEWGV